MQNHQMGSQMKGRTPSSIKVLLPADVPKEPAACQGRRPGNRERLAQVPIGIGAGAFGTRKPVCQQNGRRRKDPAFGYTEKKSRDSNWPKVLTNPQPTAQIPHATKKMLMTFRALQCDAR